MLLPTAIYQRMNMKRIYKIFATAEKRGKVIAYLPDKFSEAIRTTYITLVNQACASVKVIPYLIGELLKQYTASYLGSDVISFPELPDYRLRQFIGIAVIRQSLPELLSRVADHRSGVAERTQCIDDLVFP